jgi:hypothetical protein
VAPVGEVEAKDFVEAHHYSRAYPAARFRFGGTGTESVELGRFVLLDEVPFNGETWMLGQCFSDPFPRTDSSGREVFRGHLGTIYRAHNARYLGRGTPRTLRLLPDGSVLSERASVSKDGSTPQDD